MAVPDLISSPKNPPATPLEEAVERTVTLPVTGMSCAACQVHVERALRAAPGVEEAAVNLLTNSARVRFGAEGSVSALVEAIREAGYESELPVAAAAADPGGARQEGAGELRAASADGQESPAETARRREELGLRRRAVFALTAGLLLMVVSLPLMSAPGARGGSMAGFRGRADSLLPWLFALPRGLLGAGMLLVTLIGMAWAGGSIYRRAWVAARHGTSNMHTLVALGTLSAFLYSGAATLAPGFFLAHRMKPEVYYDSVLLILGFLLLGSWLDLRAKRRTLDALRGFTALRPEMAAVMREGVEQRVPIEEVGSGEMVIVRPGERLPVDGVVREGTSSVDESLLTGEARPVVRTEGDQVIGGSLNYDGLLRYQATSVGKSSLLGQIVALMESAQASKAPMQQLADQVSRVFVPVVLGVAGLTFVAWTLAVGDAGRALAVAIAVLVIACPCAMGLAVPAAFTVAVGRAAQLGVLFKGGEALERLASVDTVVFDKTGTLTLGQPRITGISLAGQRAGDAPASQEQVENLLLIAASLEHGSEHPLAAAVLSYAAAEGVLREPVADLRAKPGRGVTGRVGSIAAAAGNAALMAELKIPLLAPPDPASTGTLLHIAADGRHLGTLVAEDTLRDGAGRAIAALHQMGLRTMMLTGDSWSAAAAMASAAGIEEFQAELLPAAKLAQIVTLQGEGHRVAMVGDGINDAAALAQADAGLTIGSGTDLARQAGDAILLRGEPAEIVKAIALARHARSTMRQNLGWALAYNVLGIPLAAGVLYPWTGLLLSPAIASAAMALSSVSVLANSLRLRRYTPAVL